MLLRTIVIDYHCHYYYHYIYIYIQYCISNFIMYCTAIFPPHFFHQLDDSWLKKTTKPSVEFSPQRTAGSPENGRWTQLGKWHLGGLFPTKIVIPPQASGNPWILLVDFLFGYLNISCKQNSPTKKIWVVRFRFKTPPSQGHPTFHNNSTTQQLETCSKVLLS